MEFELWSDLHLWHFCFSFFDYIFHFWLRYDRREFSVDSKAEYWALSSTRSQKKTKTNNASAPLIQCRLRCVKSVRKEQEWLWRKGFVKEMSFKSGVKGRGSERWWERRWWLWWGDIHRMRWARRRVNTMRLTEWRRELIPKVRWCISKGAVGDL